MEFRTLQWNIGGGRIRAQDDDPLADESYGENNTEYFRKLIAQHHPDIVTLQEVHKNLSTDQGEEIARGLGFGHFITDPYSLSHIEDGQQLSQSVLSRHPIRNHQFDFLYNPRYEIVRPNGSIWISHDKGVTVCSTALPNGKTLEVVTVHMIPFRKFGVDITSEDVQKILKEFTGKISSRADVLLLQGDFNIDNASLKEHLPDLFKMGLEEVVLTDHTTPSGRKYDHVLYRGMKHLNSCVMTDTLADHYPVFSVFELT